ncbi:multidrug DMT transporter permease [Leifsonia sp. ZF2019]|uniref:multidrug DMT transporter permease n=1 Tax=Leifsonia sp. ZF2019 TaxID=2781978 RepID=UPI001CBE1F5D|nr:multidrug DMT transporter permease [Leifsonia sp. ZF2019]UAJ78940.1 multidrug DMT transporter permease [Leifsonia sp. ZF2019]
MTAPLESQPLLGIGLALVSALVLSVGNLLQARGVAETADRPGASGLGGRALGLLRDRPWLLGALLLGAAIVLQMGSLAFAPLIVVQPVGVSALVFTVALTAVVGGRRPSRAELRAIAVCVVGVAAFVTVAALVSTQHTIGAEELIAVLVVLAFVLLANAVLLVAGRSRPVPPVLFVLLGGVYSAFVATLGKTVILRVQTALQLHWFAVDATNLLTIGCIVGIGVAGALSIAFVQRAHAGNRPEVVVAGLTVIDPTVAVVLGITILGEASGAPLWAFAAFVAAGGVAVAGVFVLSRAARAGTA